MNWMFYVIIENRYGPLYEIGEYAFKHIRVKGNRRSIGSWDAQYAGRYQLGVF